MRPSGAPRPLLAGGKRPAPRRCRATRAPRTQGACRGPAALPGRHPDIRWNARCGACRPRFYRATSRPAAPPSAALVRFGPCAPAAATRSPPRRGPGPGAAPRLFRSGTCAGSASLRPPRPLAPLRLPSGSASFRSALPGGRAALCSASPVCSAQPAGPPPAPALRASGPAAPPPGRRGASPRFFSPRPGGFCARVHARCAKARRARAAFGRAICCRVLLPCAPPVPAAPAGGSGEARGWFEVFCAVF